MHYTRDSQMREIDKVRIEILRAKIERKPQVYIQKLQQRLDKLSRAKKDGNL